MKYLMAVILSLTLLLGGCGGGHEDAWNSEDIGGMMPDLKFQLTDENDQSVTEQAFKGKIALMYFGYTHCPDVCPTTLSILTRALKTLGPEKADKVRILFVSVDPARDTPALLKRYTDAFSPRVVGLTGTRDQLDALSKRYRVSYRYGDPDEAGNYEVYHSSAVFVFDGSGEVRLLIQQADVGDIAADMERLVDGAQLGGGPVG